MRKPEFLDSEEAARTGNQMHATKGQLLVIALLAGCQRQNAPVPDNKRAEEKPIVSKQQSFKWPALPTDGFISGRAATMDDLKAGRGVFLTGGKPLEIDVPQYAYHVDQESKQRTPGIVVQAETSTDGKLSLVGMRKIGEPGEVVGVLDEFTLLGTKPPQD